MAARITLDDGRTHCTTSLGAQGMLLLISEALPQEHAAMQRWLADIAERPAPYQDFDTRGLSDTDRSAFWSAAVAAFAELRERFGPTFLEQENMFAANALNILLRLKRDIECGIAAKETRAFNGEQIDFTDLWS